MRTNGMTTGGVLRELLGEHDERAPTGSRLAKPAATVVLAFVLGAASSPSPDGSSPPPPSPA